MPSTPPRALLLAAALAVVGCADADPPGPTLDGIDPVQSDGGLTPDTGLQPESDVEPEMDLAPDTDLAPDATLRPDSLKTQEG